MTQKEFAHCTVIQSNYFQKSNKLADTFVFIPKDIDGQEPLVFCCSSQSLPTFESDEESFDLLKNNSDSFPHRSAEEFRNNVLMIPMNRYDGCDVFSSNFMRINNSLIYGHNNDIGQNFTNRMSRKKRNKQTQTGFLKNRDNKVHIQYDNSEIEHYRGVQQNYIKNNCKRVPHDRICRKSIQKANNKFCNKVDYQTRNNAWKTEENEGPYFFHSVVNTFNRLYEVLVNRTEIFQPYRKEQDSHLNNSMFIESLTEDIHKSIDYTNNPSRYEINTESSAFLEIPNKKANVKASKKKFSKIKTKTDNIFYREHKEELHKTLINQFDKFKFSLQKFDIYEASGEKFMEELCPKRVTSPDKKPEVKQRNASVHPLKEVIEAINYKSEEEKPLENVKNGNEIINLKSPLISSNNFTKNNLETEKSMDNRSLSTNLDITYHKTEITTSDTNTSNLPNPKSEETQLIKNPEELNAKKTGCELSSSISNVQTVSENSSQTAPLDENCLDSSTTKEVKTATENITLDTGEPVVLFNKCGFPLTDLKGRKLKNNFGNELISIKNVKELISNQLQVYDCFNISAQNLDFNPIKGAHLQDKKEIQILRENNEPERLFNSLGFPLNDENGVLLYDSQGILLVILDSNGIPICSTNSDPIFVQNGQLWLAVRENYKVIHFGRKCEHPMRKTKQNTTSNIKNKSDFQSSTIELNSDSPYEEESSGSQEDISSVSLNDSAWLSKIKNLPYSYNLNEVPMASNTMSLTVTSEMANDLRNYHISVKNSQNNSKRSLNTNQRYQLRNVEKSMNTFSKKKIHYSEYNQHVNSKTYGHLENIYIPFYKRSSCNKNNTSAVMDDKFDLPLASFPKYSPTLSNNPYDMLKNMDYEYPFEIYSPFHLQHLRN